MPKMIILCADDYGYHSFISRGIINLLERQRLSAVSCLSSLSHFAEQAQWLSPFANKIDIGIHLNLTIDKPLGEAPSLTKKSGKFYSLPELIIRAHLRQLKHDDISHELTMQIEQFVSTFNKFPDFIDGHEHIHHLPMIREAILDICFRKFKLNNIYIRSVYEPYPKLWQGMAKFKRVIIQTTGAHKFKQQLLQHQLAHNQSFAGYYNFSKSANYAKFFPLFLNQINSSGMIMCHPALPNSPYEDKIHHNRGDEYHYFISPQFLEDCQKANVKLVRYQDL